MYHTGWYLLFRLVHQYKNTSVSSRFRCWSYWTCFSCIKLYTELRPENENWLVTKIQTNKKKYTNGKENKNNPCIFIATDFLALVPFCHRPYLLFFFLCFSDSCISFKCILRLSFVFIKSKVPLFRVMVCPDTHPRELSTNILKLQLPKELLDRKSVV